MDNISVQFSIFRVGHGNLVSTASVGRVGKSIFVPRYTQHYHIHVIDSIFYDYWLTSVKRLSIKIIRKKTTKPCNDKLFIPPSNCGAKPKATF